MSKLTKNDKNLSNNHIERTWPTQETLNALFHDFPDHKQRYEFAMTMIEDKNVADIACGAGYGSFLMGSIAKSVTGFDISEDALAHAKSHFSKKNVSFDHANNISKNKFDIIVSFETLEHISEKDGDDFLKTLHNSLKDSGLLIISTPINRNPSVSQRENVTPYHIREYNEKEFSEKLRSNDFKVKHLFGQCNAITEKLERSSIIGVSLGQIMRLGFHRVLPSSIRNLLRDRFIGQDIEKINKSVHIVPDDLSKASVQIAICGKIQDTCQVP